MTVQRVDIQGIPSIIWGADSDVVYIHVHGKMGSKEYARTFAEIADEKGIQTLSFDLPCHGERMKRNERCDIWQAEKDLNAIWEYCTARWKEIRLYACSLGAYFSLYTYQGRAISKALFQSPIIDMKWLVEHMMLWSGITKEQLKSCAEIETPIDLLRWDYYERICEQKLECWPTATSVLYAGRDNLQPVESIQNFADQFHAELTISPDSEHPFMEQRDYAIVESWLRSRI